MPETRIIPAILSQTTEDLFSKLSLIEDLVDRIQIDIVGPAFSAEVSIGVEAIAGISRALVLDVQLMVREPISFLGRCEQAGVERIFGHVEKMRDQGAFVEHALALGVDVGLALDLETPVAVVEQHLGDLDAILLMAVPAGKSGQRFDGRVLEKIRAVKSLHPTLPVCVDGGIAPQHLAVCVEAGASEFAVGSFLWESRDIKRALEELTEASR